MVKRLFGLVLLLCGIITAGAQEMPLNPNVVHGQLPNGLNYYILHNEEPKGRANFYIAQKVGSTLEKPEQLGLAHFLEHMCFNGTKTFPHDTMLQYLQNKGLRFGADINAYTSFDETVYNIDAVPTNDEALIDSVLLVLHDWSCDLQLADDEIDAERGVIQGEWRQRNDANTRMMTTILPQIYEEYQYHQMPIGTMDVVMNFPYKALRDYYHTWYRPDQQGIIIVGDFDAKAMEQKVIKLFSPIVMPSDVPERKYPVVSDNKDLIFVGFEDPELQNTLVRFAIKSDKVPFEQRNSIDYYVMTSVCEELITNMIDARLSELSQKSNCKFAQAGVYFGDFWVSKTKDAFNVVVVPKDGVPVAEAFEEAYSEVVRACKTGFTDSELGRAKEDMKSNYERAFNEKDKTKSEKLGKELIRKFIDNEPAPGIEAEWQLIQMILPNVSAQMLNQLVSGIITPDNQVMVVSQPKADGKVLPTKEQMLQVITGVQNKQFEAYVDNVISEPLIAKAPKAGKIKGQKELAEFGATELTLSNGAKVIVKTTDFADDEIRFSAVCPVGKMAYGADQASDLKLVDLAVGVSKLGKFSQNDLQKALAGKKASLGYSMENNQCGFSGNSTKKDLETLMQLVYLNFTDIQPDEEYFAAMKQMVATQLANADKDPSTVFMKRIYNDWYDGNIMVRQLETADLDKADYARMLQLAKNTLTNAADYTFIFVGNVDVATLKPLLETYIASLPGNAKKGTKMKNQPLLQKKGQTNDVFQFPVQSDIVKEFVIIHGNNIPYSLENDAKISLMGDILDILYTKSLREELGGTYGASCQSSLNPRTGEWNLLYVYDTNDKQRQDLDDRAVSDLNNLLKNGANMEEFQKVKGAAVTQCGLNLKKNGYWMAQLTNYVNLGINTSKMKEAYEGVTLEGLNAFMRGLYDGQNRIHVTLDGVVTEKK